MADLEDRVAPAADSVGLAVKVVLADPAHPADPVDSARVVRVAGPAAKVAPAGKWIWKGAGPRWIRS